MAGHKEKQPSRDEDAAVLPIMAQQAEAAAIAAREDEERQHAGGDATERASIDTLNTSTYQESVQSVDTTAFGEGEDDEHDLPPPAYGEHYGEIREEREDLGTKATVAEDGRVNIRIDQRTRKLTTLLGPALREQQHLAEDEEPPPPPYIPPSLGGEEGIPPPPPMNIAIHVVGSRGDVQPFIALGKVLKETYGHRVRLATHPNFKDFVTEHGLEFFSIGGDPAKLMAFMVKNPGLMPGIESLKSGDIGQRRSEIREMLKGCWRSCYESGDGSGPEASDRTVEAYSQNPGATSQDDLSKPFVADAIIANPPSFAHIHIAEKLAIPLHVMFTMPYSPTQAFPHPLANIQSSNADKNMTNYISYALVEMLTWQGLGDVINDFRKRSLGLDEIGMWSPSVLQRLKIPHTYCWSPALIPKPKDWRQNISISGFYFLNTASNYTPEPDLKAFLEAGPPPVYIGFGSIVLDDPNAMTKLLFDAVRATGQRALVSKGWGGMGADELGKPDNVFMLGNCPHDWLFQRVSCVVHHGGAGTTAAGITAGKPTVVVPFFGDQAFWGMMVARAEAGPDPIPHKQLTPENLAEAIEFCLKPQSQAKAKELASSIAEEKGSDKGAQTFHQFLDVDKLRCSLAPSRMAVWSVRRSDIRLSAMAACTLANEGVLDFKDLKLFRSREYEVDTGPWDPISGGAASIVGTGSTIMGGIMDMPLGTFNQMQANQQAKKKEQAKREAEEAEAETVKAEESKQAKQDELEQESVASESGRTETTRASDTESTVAATDNSSDRAGSSDTVTPATSQTGSTFNLEESLARIGSPISTVSSSDADHRRQSSSKTLEVPGQQNKGKSRSTSGAKGQFDAKKHFETATSTGKGVYKIVGAGFKSPMEFSDNVARGFHNAPKLYGDDTVRDRDRITDFKSGLTAAGKSFGFGLYDGITGLVTQPAKGLQKEGPAGFLKGIGKGIGGVIFKPGAAFFGIPGYTMKGVYKEMQKMLGSSVQNYIIAARTAQGYDEWNNASPQERDDIVKRYLFLLKQPKKKRSPEGLVRSILTEQRRTHTIQTETRQTSQPEASSSAHQRSKAANSGTVGSGSTPHVQDSKQAKTSDAEGSVSSDDGHQIQLVDTDESAAKAADADLEEAIRLSVQETSRGNTDEDAEIERAIRASMAEHARSHGAADASDEESEALRKAMNASLADSKDGKAPGTGDSTKQDEELEKALANSLREQRAQHGGNNEWDSDPDEDFQRAIKESQHTATGQGTGKYPSAPPPAYEESSASKDFPPDVKSKEEKSEEQIVMEYVKRQSLLEQKHRQDQPRD